jgi:hypothetical protein
VKISVPLGLPMPLKPTVGKTLKNGKQYKRLLFGHLLIAKVWFFRRKMEKYPASEKA